MKKLSPKVLLLTVVALLALLLLAVLAVTGSRYDLFLIGLIGIATIGVLLLTRPSSKPAELKSIGGKLDQLAEIDAAIKRLEQNVAAPPRMLDGSTERQLAETAAKFDWLVRKHEEQSEQFDALQAELQTLRGLLTERPASAVEADGRLAAGEVR